MRAGEDLQCEGTSRFAMTSDEEEKCEDQDEGVGRVCV